MEELRLKYLIKSIVVDYMNCKRLLYTLWGRLFFASEMLVCKVPVNNTRANGLFLTERQFFVVNFIYLMFRC